MGKNKIQRNEIGAHFKLLYVYEKKREREKKQKLWQFHN